MKSLLIYTCCSLAIVALYFIKPYAWSGFVAGIIFTYLLIYTVGKILLVKAQKRHR